MSGGQTGFGICTTASSMDAGGPDAASTDAAVDAAPKDAAVDAAPKDAATDATAPPADATAMDALAD
jgi:hypothetical protein